MEGTEFDCNYEQNTFVTQLPSIQTRDMSNSLDAESVFTETEEQERCGSGRRRSLTFGGIPSVPDEVQVGLGSRRNTITGTCLSPLKKFRNAAKKALTTAKENGKDADSTSPLLPRRKNSLCVGGGNIPESSSKMAASRRTSMASLVGLVVFKKMYNAQLEAYVRKEMEDRENATISEAPSIQLEAENWESSDSEAEEEDENPTSAREVALSLTSRSYLSTEGQLAMLRCYDEKLKSGIATQYPHYKHALYRTQTPAVHNKTGQRRKPGQKGELPKIEESGSIVNTHQLKRAGTLLDALKAEKGEMITTGRYLAQDGSKVRPKSKRLVKKYNSWTNSWSQLESNSTL